MENSSHGTEVSSQPVNMSDTQQDSSEDVVPVRRWWVVGVITVALLCILIGIWLHNRYEDIQHKRATQAIADSKVKADAGAAALDAVLGRIMRHAQVVADDLQSGKLGRKSLNDGLYKIIYSDPDITEIGVAYEPFAWDPAIRLHGVAYTLDGHKIVAHKIDVESDYTEAGVAWYEQPMAEKKAVWIMPQHLETSGARVAIYVMPFRLPGAAAWGGVVYAAYPLDKVNNILNAMELGEADFSYVVSEKGDLLAHPNRDYIDGETEFKSPSVLTVSAVIPAINSKIFVTATQPEEKEPRVTRRILATIAVVFGIGALLLVIGAAQYDSVAARRSWIVSITCSATFLAIVVFVLKLADIYPDNGRLEGAAITNPSVLKRFVAKQNSDALRKKQLLPLLLPTGIMVQSLTFISGKDMRVTGYVWQRYRKGIHDNVKQGFLIPESDSFTAHEIYRDERSDGEVVGWSFNAVLHVEFDNRHFPFDVQNVRIPLWPQDFYRNVLLVPDLEAYPLSMPAARPGLRQDLTIPNWNIETSVFDYAQRTYKTNFGFGAENAPANLPELGLTISGRRQISGPFVTYLLPVTVVMVMLFTLLILSNRDEKRIKFLGFDATKVITACGGFFLVVIFSEIDLRKTLGSRDIVYLEYFHFTAYLAILAVAISAIVFAYDKCETRWNHDNYNVKRFYWPMVSLMVLVFTLVTFV